nr:MAG TPA: hypothetical protein [Caudoviricetes sp.]
MSAITLRSVVMLRSEIMLTILPSEIYGVVAATLPGLVQITCGESDASTARARN